MSSVSVHGAGDDAVQRVLEARARALAEPPRMEQSARTQAVIVVALRAEQYGLPLRQVREVRSLRALAPVPGTPPFWAGLVNLRGRLYPVLDLAHYLALPSAETPAGQKVVVVAASGLEVALLVDDVLGVRDVPDTDIGPLLADMAGTRGQLVAGVTPDLLALLNLDTLLADPRLVVESETS